MKFSIIFISIVWLTNTYSCKKVPTFPVENPYDPNAVNYIVPKPEDLSFTYEFSDKNNFNYQLAWENPKEIYTGVIIERYSPEMEEFILLDSLNNKENSYIYTPDSTFIEEKIRVINYHIIEDNDTLYSAGVEKIATQNVYHLEATLNDKEVSLSWNHEFTNENIEGIIEKQVVGETEILYYNFNIADSSFTDPNPVDPLVITQYSVYATDEYYNSLAEHVFVGQNGVDRPTEILLQQNNPNYVLLQVKVDGASDQVQTTLRSKTTDYELTLTKNTTENGNAYFRFYDLDGQLAPFEIETKNILYETSSEALFSELHSNQILVKSDQRYLFLDLASNHHFLVNNGTSIAYLKAPENSGDDIIPTVVNITSGNTIYSFESDKNTSSLSYSKTANKLYSNQSEGLWEFNLVNGSERLIKLPDAVVVSSELVVNGINNIAYMQSTSNNVILFDLISEEQIGTLEIKASTFKLSPDQKYLYAYSHSEEYYEIYDTNNHQLIYSSKSRIPSVEFIPEFFFGVNEAIIWSKEQGVFYLDFINGGYEHLGDNFISGDNNTSAFYNYIKKEFYVTFYSREADKGQLSVFDIETKSLIQIYDFTYDDYFTELISSELVFNYNTNQLFNFSDNVLYVFDFGYEWFLID